MMSAAASVFSCMLLVCDNHLTDAAATLLLQPAFAIYMFSSEWGIGSAWAVCHYLKFNDWGNFDKTLIFLRSANSEGHLVSTFLNTFSVQHFLSSALNQNIFDLLCSFQQCSVTFVLLNKDMIQTETITFICTECQRIWWHYITLTHQ